MEKLEFDEQEDDCWTCTSFRLTPESEPISLTLVSETKPSQGYIESAIGVLNSIDDRVLMASALILENYSYEHFRDLGVDETLLLKDETPEAMSKVAKLKSVWFDGSTCENFEMSFTVPWDEHHSFDVEFEGGRAVCCSVNG